MPEVASVPLQLIETGRLYQPSWSAGRAGLTATVGGVASYCRPKSSEALFPAKSVQLPWAVALAPSGPAYMSDEHEAIPEVASVPCQSSRTALLYQPFASGTRPAVASVTAGGAASYLTRYASDELLPARSVHVTLRLVPVVSGPEYVVDVHETPPESESAPLPEIEIGVRYQPAAFGARAGTAVVVGAAVSIRTTNAADELFPAMSVQLPLSVDAAVSGPLYVLFGSQLAKPDSASEPFQVTWTPDFSHPFALGSGLGAAVVDGGIES